VTDSVAGAKTVVNGKDLALDQTCAYNARKASVAHQKTLTKITPSRIFNSSSQFKNENMLFVTLKASLIVRREIVLFLSDLQDIGYRQFRRNFQEETDGNSKAVADSDKNRKLDVS
jgi:hypothetical protein